MSKLDEKRINELHNRVMSLSMSKKPINRPQKPKNLSFLNNLSIYKKENLKYISPFQEVKPDTVEQIAEKINSKEAHISFKVLKDVPENEKFNIEDVIKELKKKQYLEPKDIKGLPINMSDMRWHGGGLSTVSIDATLTGNGTPSSPLSITGGTTTFIDNEIVAGSGTTYTLANTPVLGSVHLFAKGQRLTPTTDYTISGIHITTTDSWASGDLLADYRK